MSEADMPFGEIIVGTEKVLVTRDNLMLFRHMGTHAVYDHCYIAREEGGIFIWAYDPAFENFSKLAHEHRAYMVLNKPQVSEGDRETYISHVSHDLEFASEFAMKWYEEQAEI